MGLREAFWRRECSSGVADNHVVAQETPDAGDGGGEVDRAEDQHFGRRRPGLHEHLDLWQGVHIESRRTGAITGELTPPGLAPAEHCPHLVHNGRIQSGIAHAADMSVGEDGDPAAGQACRAANDPGECDRLSGVGGLDGS
jgi:hypothetical protein